jgi:hypothetical protein
MLFIATAASIASFHGMGPPSARSFAVHVELA